MSQTLDDNRIDLGRYAERAYLEYAMSVVKGRALPDVADGQKPVQRRILFAMHDMRLNAAAKPVKSARVVGEILGKYHPHGDASAYDAMVRMAQEFTLRYPLIDGIGNFGSRDGDGAAAMRYTEARLTPIAELLLSELDMGTVDFAANYDGAFDEPVVLPARLPMVLLNGASGIAVGLATEIPPHNLRETAAAAVALLKNPALGLPEIMQHLSGPDFPGGAQIISSQADIEAMYASGKGSVRVRARYEIELLARGQWRAVVTELPPGASAQKILAEIEELTNPKPRTGKKALSQEQQNTRALMLSFLDRVRDESDAQHPVRLVFEPKSGRIDAEEFMRTLLAQTSLEGNVSVNLVMIGRDGRPQQTPLLDILRQWLDFRVHTVTRRLEFRLQQVDRRIHLLEGRLTVFLHIDEVIRVIREADDPKTDLMTAFGLSEIQAEDILEIRLRQLARLEGIRLEAELDALKEERDKILHVLDNGAAKNRLVIKEIESDAKKYGDARRTIIQTASRASLTQTAADEAITLIVSQQGWIRARTGHHLDLGALTFKEGDSLLSVLETRTIWPVVVLDAQGRSYSVNAADVPGGRGDGVPLASLVDLPAGAASAAILADKPDAHYLLANSGGYGFVARLGDLTSRVKAGKVTMTLEPGETVLPPVRLPESLEAGYVIVLSTEPRLLAFKLSEMKIMAKGRGLQLMALEKSELQWTAIIQTEQYIAHWQGKRGAAHQEKLFIADVLQKRGRKGKPMPFGGDFLWVQEHG